MILSLSFLSSCNTDSFSKKLICNTLYGNYTGKADFVFSGTDKNVVGKIDITKNGITTVTFTEPSEYSNISIKSDEAGNSDTFSFELSGIPANVPKAVASELSLMFSLFSNSIPNKIEALPTEAFKHHTDEDSLENQNLIDIVFDENDINYSITYDRNTGFPMTMSAGNDAFSVSVNFTQFDIIQQQ